MTSVAAAGRERISVLVPTYRRPADLRRCLAALRAQTRPPEQTVIAVRDDDYPSLAVLDELGREDATLCRVVVEAPGMVHALNKGLEAATGEIVAITDDDAAPRPDWLERIAAAFASDRGVGGVGGRDWVHHGTVVEDGARSVVGRLQWYGRCIGNHHLGVGAAREVDFLKGANMSFRRAAIGALRFDTRLRGEGAQVCNDMAFSFAVRRAGWRLLYDPLVAVDHYPAVRFDDDARSRPSYGAQRNAAFNQALVVSEALSGPRAWVFLAWAIVVGTSSAPGLLQAARLGLKEGASVLPRVHAAIAGAWDAWRGALS